MKPFNLELAKAKHPIQTRDGRPARIICYDKKCGDYPIVALIYNAIRDCEEIKEYTIDGKYLRHKLRNDEDLVMVPIKREGWVNIYKSAFGNIFTGDVYPSKKEAISHIHAFGDTNLDTIKIEWEE